MEVNCPRCGCNDVELLTTPTTVATSPTASIPGPAWATPGRAECNHCRERFPYTDDGESSERVRPLTFEVYCPECKSPNTKVDSSPPPAAGFKTRYLSCTACGHNFKTVDRVSPAAVPLHTR